MENANKSSICDLIFWMSRQTTEQIAGVFLFLKCFSGLSFKEYWLVITNNVNFIEENEKKQLSENQLK